MKKYHPLLVSLHWILAIGIILLLFGGTMLADLESNDPQKIFGMTGHMVIANVVLVLMSIRFIVRMKTQKPAPADIGNALLNKGAAIAHYVMYLLVFVMAASGWSMALAAGLPGILFGDSGNALPDDLTIYPARVAHGIVATVFMLVILAHFLAALYHQFVRKDGLLSRMWFGERTKRD